MISILSREAAAAVEDAARGPALLTFDFDGTLAPLVQDRRAASMGKSTQTLLRMAAILYPVAVISGRDRADVSARIGKAPVVAIIGNHGAEPEDSSPDPRISRRVRAWAAVLRSVFEGERGVEVEEKALSVSVHCRDAVDGLDVQRRVFEAATALPGTRVFGGHAVVNIASEEAPTKGEALDALASRLNARGVVFVGDDVTDEDAFSSRAVTIGIRVGLAKASAATYFLPAQHDVDELLRAFIAARCSMSGIGERWLELCGKPKPGGSE